MRCYFICLLLIFGANDFMSAQIKIAPNGNHFEYKDQFYGVNYRGISQYMTDRKAYDKVLYEELKPHYDKIRNRRNASIAIASASITASTIIMAVGLRRTTQANTFAPTETSHTPLIISAVLILGGSVATGILLPNKHDFLSFLSTNNRIFEDQGLELGATTNVPGLLGLGLVLRF